MKNDDRLGFGPAVRGGDPYKFQTSGKRGKIEREWLGTEIGGCLQLRPTERVQKFNPGGRCWNRGRNFCNSARRVWRDTEDRHGTVT